MPLNSKLLPLAGLLSLAAIAATPAVVHAAPATTQAAAQTVTVEGELEVFVEDYRDGRTRTRHYIKTSQGRYALRFDKRPTDLPSGTKVRVQGRKVYSEMALDGAQVVEGTAPAVAPYAMGEQKVAVILVNFSDDTSQPVTPAAVNTLLFDTIDNFYQENSFGQTWMNGQVFGYYTIDQSKTVCDATALSAKANAAAAAAGVDLSAYPRKVYMFPKVASCGWMGFGQVGGQTTSAWINGDFSQIVTAHELGHNLGLRHAHAKNCDVAPLGNTCTNIDYGDAADTMGNIKPGHFNAFEKERLGWLNDGISPPITTVTTSGRYAIQPYSSSSVGPKALKIAKGLDANGWPAYYYVEFRQPIGADSVLTTGNLTQGVTVRMGSPKDNNSSYQLDMTPGSSTTTQIELSDGALAVGRTYTDATSGVSITLVSADPNGALVDVTVGTATPPPTTPPSGGTLTEALGLDKATYVRGDTVFMSALVKKDGVALGGASVAFVVTLPNAAKTTINATTGTDGYARATYRVAKGKAALGGYGVAADATSNGSTATANASFSVK